MTATQALWSGLKQGLAAKRDLHQIPDLRADRLFFTLIAALVVLFVSVHQLGGYHAGFAVLNNAGRNWPEDFWAMATFLGDEKLAFALALFFARRQPQVLWALMLAALVGTLYSRGLKPWFDMPRPPAVLAEGSFHLIGPAHHSKSFPSGHTLTAFVFFGVWLYFLRLPGLLLMFLATLVGVSRVMVGVHWPLDAIAGAAGGLLAAWIGVYLSARWHWGLRPVGHALLLILPLVGAIGLLRSNGGYEAADWLRYPIALGGLAVFARDYLIQPLRLRDAA